MKLLQTTTTENHLLKIEQHVQKTNRMINALIVSLNQGYSYLWNLPDDQLKEVLQFLVNTDKFDKIFNAHAKAAQYVNEMLDLSESEGARVLTGVGREFTITDGVVALTPLAESEPIIYEEPQIIE